MTPCRCPWSIFCFRSTRGAQAHAPVDVMNENPLSQPTLRLSWAQTILKDLAVIFQDRENGLCEELVHVSYLHDLARLSWIGRLFLTGFIRCLKMHTMSANKRPFLNGLGRDNMWRKWGNGMVDTEEGGHSDRSRTAIPKPCTLNHES